MTEHKPILIADDPNLPQPVSSKYKFANKVAFFVLFLIAAAIGVFAFWAAEPSEALDITNTPFPVRVIHQDNKLDDILILTVDYCKKSSKQGTVRTSFVSTSHEIFLPISKEQLPKGCRSGVDVPVIIPKGLPPDTYKIKFRTTYNVNPIKSSIVKDFESRSFSLVSDSSPVTQ